MENKQINTRLAELAKAGDRNAAILLRLRRAGHVNGGNCPHCKKGN